MLFRLVRRYSAMRHNAGLCRGWLELEPLGFLRIMHVQIRVCSCPQQAMPASGRDGNEYVQTGIMWL